MIIKNFVTGPLGNNVYLLIDEVEKRGAVIDPAKGSYKKIMAYIEDKDITIEKVFLTHSHWDHIGDAYKFQKEMNAKVYVHSSDVENLKNPGADSLFSMVQIESVSPDILLSGEEVIEFGKEKIHVIHTPGHSPGSVCYYLKDENILFSGDTLFQGSYGRVDFNNADPSKMKDSLIKLRNLPPGTIYYPGHGPSSTIGEEKWLSDIEKLF